MDFIWSCALSRCEAGRRSKHHFADMLLQQLDRIAAVRPIANAEHSTAESYLRGDTSPDLDRWAQQLVQVANASYDFRGVEVSVKRECAERALPINQLLDRPTSCVGAVRADREGPIRSLDGTAKRGCRGTFGLRGAHRCLAWVPGPLRQTDAGWIVHVRCFEAQSKSSPAGGD